MNSFGNIFRLTTFGESHGLGVGGVIDGMPAGVEVDTEFIQHELDRRRPGQSSIVTARKESDKVEILSGVFEGRSTGTPIGFVVYNQDQHSNDYDNLRDCYRPSHADYTYAMKYGVRDHRGEDALRLGKRYPVVSRVRWPRVHWPVWESECVPIPLRLALLLCLGTIPIIISIVSKKISSVVPMRKPPDV